MCTLTLAWQVFADEPVVVAANRDERYDRPSSPPAVRDWAARVLAPVDDEAGGTWAGYNEHGVFVGLTNRWVDLPPGERSRGLLVRDALGYGSAEDAARYVERAVDAHAYEGFELVAADADAALLLEWDGRLAVRNLEPGVHVVVNVGAALGGGGAVEDAFSLPAARPDAGERQAANARALRDHLAPAPGGTVEEWVERARVALGDHAFGVCVHGDDADPDAPPATFGTVSAFVARLGPRRRTMAFADGPPCRVEFHPVRGTV